MTDAPEPDTGPPPQVAASSPMARVVMVKVLVRMSAFSAFASPLRRRETGLPPNEPAIQTYSPVIPV